jgi:hypothetical protein
VVTAIFVHGSGVRETAHKRVLADISAGLANLSNVVSVKGCCWGDAVGAKLNAGGSSIPKYALRGGQAVTSGEDQDVALWRQLYSDPFFEIRVLALGSTVQSGLHPNELAPGQLLDRAVRSLDFCILSDVLRKAELSSTIDIARDQVVSSQVYKAMLPTVTREMAIYLQAISRAIVAQAIREASTASLDDPAAAISKELRDDAIAAIRVQLGADEASPVDWIVRRLLNTGVAMVGTGLASLTTPLMSWRRGQAMDFASPICADVLLYQSRGKRIRDFINLSLTEVERNPIVAIGHSLGGVALVDLLNMSDLHERVKLLITIGSQAPYLYEIDALPSLRFGDALPNHFPPWINLYDPRDFVSFCGHAMFHERIHDFELHSRLPFPQSHGAYFQNANTYAIIRSSIERYAL